MDTQKEYALNHLVTCTEQLAEETQNLPALIEIKNLEETIFSRVRGVVKNEFIMSENENGKKLYTQVIALNLAKNDVRIIEAESLYILAERKLNDAYASKEIARINYDNAKLTAELL